MYVYVCKYVWDMDASLIIHICMYVSCRYIGISSRETVLANIPRIFNSLLLFHSALLNANYLLQVVTHKK